MSFRSKSKSTHTFDYPNQRYQANYQRKIENTKHTLLNRLSIASLCIRCLQQRSCGLASFCKRHLRQRSLRTVADLLLESKQGR
ncbi:hypothetical protein Hanom_Chr14g01308131 [Helianthus anomalus]